MPDMFVCTPIHDGRVCYQYMSGVLDLQRHYQRRDDWGGFQFDIKLGSLVGRNRDVLTARFLESGADHMMCIDSDIGFTADHVQQLLDCDAPIVAGCYAMKSPSTPIPAKLLPGSTGMLREADFVPAGFMLLRRDAVERMVRAFPSLRYKTVAQGEVPALWSAMRPGAYGEGEDVAFCRRAREAGLKVMLHTGVTVEHVGTKVYTPRGFETLEGAPQTEEDIIARDSLLHQSGVELPAIIEEVSAITTGQISPARNGRIRPASFLEIGTFRGATCAALAKHFGDALQITTVDLPQTEDSPWNPQPSEQVGICYRQLGLGRSITQHREGSRAFFNKALDRGWKFDVIFIDGDHSPAGCMADLFGAANVLSAGGKILVHDYTEEGDAERPAWTLDVARAVDDFAAHNGWKKTRLPGWLVRLERKEG